MLTLRCCPLIRNGEIYNHEKLLSNELEGHSINSHSDCAVIGPLYQKFGFPALCPMLDGMFAVILADSRTGEYFACRDHMGIASMYYGRGPDGQMWFASEMKALQDNCEDFAQFPPVSSSSHVLPRAPPPREQKAMFFPT